MFCTSAPLSTNPRRPQPRRGSTLDAMIEAVREQMLVADCVTEGDLRIAGFTDGEIAAHGVTAIARVRRERADKLAA